MLSGRRKVALVALPAMLGLATVAAIVVISVSYRDSNHRWTAIAAILAGSALLAALVGLPIGLYQLFAVERDIAQLNLVPPQHYAQLRGILERCQINLGRQVGIEFGDPPGGLHLFRDAFYSHFPDLIKPFAKWDAAVARVEAARASYAAALEREADTRGVMIGTYDKDTILKHLQERTRPSLHLMLEEWPEGSVPVKGSVDGSIEVAGIRTAVSPPTGDSGAQRFFTENELGQAVQPLIDLCEAARRLPDVRAIAQAQDALNGLIEPTSEDIRLHLVTETIPMASRCPICQRNLAQ